MNASGLVVFEKVIGLEINLLSQNGSFTMDGDDIRFHTISLDWG